MEYMDSYVRCRADECGNVSARYLRTYDGEIWPLSIELQDTSVVLLRRLTDMETITIKQHC